MCLWNPPYVGPIDVRVFTFVPTRGRRGVRVHERMSGRIHNQFWMFPIDV